LIDIDDIEERYFLIPIDSCSLRAHHRCEL